MRVSEEVRLEIQDLHASYGSTVALAGIDLSLAAGEVVALLGPNGAGKTTLVSVVAGLMGPDSGRVTVRGELGLAPQDTGVYPTLTCRENLTLFAELVGLRRRSRDHAIAEVAKALQLSGFLDRQARDLSGGQRRRLHTAMALVHRPQVVLLDEPTTGADVQTRGLLLDHVRTLAADGAAILYSTHYLHEVEQLDAFVVIIDKGRRVASGTVGQLIATHGMADLDALFVELTERRPANVA